MLSLPSKINKGFTLLEMMVVIAIVTVMTGVLLSNLPSFRDLTTLQLVAQEVAITVRSAQVFGIGTRVTTGVFPGHGIYFCNPKSAEANPLCKKKFLLFSDDSTPISPRNKFFDDGVDAFPGGCSGECIEPYKLAGNIEICEIRVATSGADAVPLDPADKGVSITFSRLYPDAFIRTSPDQDGSYDHVDIFLKSNRENRRRQIRVYNTGGIMVTAVPTNETTICQ